MIALLLRLQRRIERSCAAHGISYPWWIPAYSSAACVALDVAAYVQRGPLDPSPAVAAAAVLALVPLLVWMIGGRIMPPLLEGLVMTGAVILYLTEPANPDFAPFLLSISAGEIAAISAMPVALAVAVIEGAVPVVAGLTGHLQGAPLFVVGVVLGADVGIALRWQMRAITAERENSVIVGEQAMLAERQRIAREVHDVVGHALSINLLHVTAARHSLQEHADIADAVDSLTEAERVGRTAMGDLRRTVTVLGSGGQTAPLPGLDDVPAMIERARLAGLNLRVESSGDAPALGPAAALGLYRIVQESLANIAKHAPESAALVRVAAAPDEVRVSVRNTLPAGHGPRPGGRGSGLPGMAARAEQMGAELRAGPSGTDWVVDLVLPLHEPRTRAAGAVHA